MSKIIISCAVTGSIHTPSMSPYLPVTAEDIADQAIEAAGAGAAILHLHARDPKDGRPSASPAHFMSFLPRIKQASGAVLNITTGGSAVMTLEERISAAKATAPAQALAPPRRHIGYGGLAKKIAESTQFEEKGVKAVLGALWTTAYASA